MTTGNRRDRAGSPWRLGSALAVLALAPITALAQGPAALPPPAPADTASTDMTTDTAPSDARSTVPVTVLGRELLEATGTASLGQALQQLSWQSNALNTQFNNGGTGSTRISLRGLGDARTLVLVNGRGHVYGGLGLDQSVDLEAIPLALVERVEIVRGPAVGLGMNAAGGVVNVVTRSNLDGVEAALFTGSTGDGLGLTYDASVALGQGFERGRIVAAAGYHQEQAILGADREAGRADHFYDWETGQLRTMGSTSVPQGYIRDQGEGAGNQAWQALVTQYPDASAFYNDPSVGWRPFQPGGTSDTGEGDLYNYAPENYLVTPLSRYHAFAAGDYRLGDQLRAFAEASYVNRRSEQQLAAVPLLTITEGVTVSADNIYNPFGRDFLDVRRRLIEADNRRNQQDIDTLRLVVGLDGALPIDLGAPAAWRWEAAYGYGSTWSTQTSSDALRRGRLANALGPGFYDAGGVPRCGTPDSPVDPACVPLDLFGGEGSITPAMLDYIGITAVSHGRNQQHQTTFDAGGDLVRASSGAGMSLQIGAEYREDSGAFTTDPRLLEVVIDPEPDPWARHDVRAAHAALSAVPFADPASGLGLELQAQGRAVDFSTSGPGMMWQLGGVLQLGNGLAVRGSQGRSMVAPALSQIRPARSEAFPVAVDPCDAAFGARSPHVDANCRADGVPDDFVDGRQQLRALIGGNPELAPEIADIRGAGIVFAPEPAPGLVLSVDYFDIAMSDVVSTLGAATILAGCYEQAPDARRYCDRIVRDPASGAIDAIDDTLTNAGGIETAGVDVQIGYDRMTPFGQFRYHLGGTWLQRHDLIDASGVVVRGKGVYDLGVYPEHRLDGAVLWDNGVLGAGAHIRYVGSFTECENNDCQALDDEEPGVLVRTHEVESYMTADLLGSVTLGSTLGQTRLAVGVRNVLDRQPPLVYNGFLANSDASAYDYTGRFAYLRLTQQF